MGLGTLVGSDNKCKKGIQNLGEKRSPEVRNQDGKLTLKQFL
jgi:hypothetical protein